MELTFPLLCVLFSNSAALHKLKKTTLCVFIADGNSHSLNLDYDASELIRCKKNSTKLRFIYNHIAVAKKEKFTS